MKVHLKFLAFAALSAAIACNNSNKSGSESSMGESSETTPASNASYVILNTGQSATIVKDSTEGSGYVYADSRKPIENDMLFVDVSTGDTLYGPKGVIVNNAVIESEGSWKLDETKVERDGDEITIKTPTEKIKMEDDEMKVKSGDSKLKVDGAESKTKGSDYKEKTDDDGETKVKPE